MRLDILKLFYEILGAEKQQDSYVEQEIEIETMGNNRLFMTEVEVPPQIQNDDLAEADQSHLEIELDEQEGAVGGILEEIVGNAQVM